MDVKWASVQFSIWGLGNTTFYDDVVWLMKVNKKWVLTSLERNTTGIDILPVCSWKTHLCCDVFRQFIKGESVSLNSICQACISFQWNNFDVHLLLSIALRLHFFFLFSLLSIKYAGHFTNCCQNNPNSPEQWVYGNSFIDADPLTSPGLALQRPLNDLNQLLKPRRRL